jgi:hypothetical protein
MIAKEGGLKNEAGQIGFSAKIVENSFVLRGDDEELQRKLKTINYTSLPIITDPVNNPLLSSSSYSNLKTTTKEADIGVLKSILSDLPELGYWRQKELTVNQMKQWLQTTGSTLENLIQSQCHCRFEMVDMNLEESKPIENVFNWFFRIIERTGHYPKPKGYKSFEEKQIEQERKTIEEKEKRIQELRELSRKKYEQEQEEKFWEMMNDADGDLYKQCHAKLNLFEKNLKGGPVFEKSMRKVFGEFTVEKAQSQEK